MDARFEESGRQFVKFSVVGTVGTVVNLAVLKSTLFAWGHLVGCHGVWCGFAGACVRGCGFPWLCFLRCCFALTKAVFDSLRVLFESLTDLLGC